MIYFREVYPINKWVLSVVNKQNSFLTHSYPSSRLRGFLGTFHSLVSTEVLILDSKPWDIPTFQGTLFFLQKGERLVPSLSGQIRFFGLGLDVTQNDPFDVSAQFHNSFVGITLQ